MFDCPISAVTQNVRNSRRIGKFQKTQTSAHLPSGSASNRPHDQLFRFGFGITHNR